MALVDSVKRFTDTALSIVQTRLALAAIDFEDELQSAVTSLLVGSASVILASFSLLFIALALLVIVWDTHRVSTLFALGGVFAILALGLAFLRRTLHLRKPPFMSATLEELDKDRAMIGPQQ
jgi:uncharacterized membrane protein YqjE